MKPLGQIQSFFLPERGVGLFNFRDEMIFTAGSYIYTLLQSIVQMYGKTAKWLMMSGQGNRKTHPSSWGGLF